MNHNRLDFPNKGNKLYDAMCRNDECSKASVKYYIGVYTLAFAIISTLVYLPFILNGKSFIWETDGMSQHYLALIYIGQWIRDILHNIFVEHSFVVPMWDFHIGAGGDILTTFNYYGLGDPLCSLSVFFPETATVHLYNIIIIIRLYLSGLFYSLYCFRMKQQGLGVLIGSFAYTFCGFSIIAGVRHPFFLVPMVFFPLMLLGAEKILSKESPAVFIISVFLSFAINFYFSYMLVILTIIYVAARFFTSVKTDVLKNLMKTLGKFIGSGLVGVMMAATLLLPVIIVYLNNSRGDIDRGVKLFHSINYYINLYYGFTGFTNAGNWTMTGFIPVTLISAFLLFRRKGEHTYIKIILSILTVILLFPILSKVMNGFAYVANRWIWGYAFIMAFVFTLMFNELTQLKAEDKKHLIICSSVYLLTCILMIDVNTNLSSIGQLIILAVITILLVSGREFFSKKTIIASISILSVASIIMNSGFSYSLLHKSYINEFVDIEHTHSMLTNTASNKLAHEMVDEFSRYEQIPNDKVRNQSIIDGSYGISYYWSLTDNYISEFLKDTQAVRYTAYDYQNFDRRSTHNALFAVKYFMTSSPDAPAPYGYVFDRTLNTTYNEFTVYKNHYDLPLGFGYSDYMTESAYNSLSAAQKQEALLDNILLTEDISGYDQNTFSLSSESLRYEILPGEDVYIEENTITTAKNNATIQLMFENTADCELYVDIKGIHHVDEIRKSDELKIEEEADATSPVQNTDAYYEYWSERDAAERLDIRRSEALVNDSEKYVIYASSGGYTTSFNLTTPHYQNYDGQHDFLMNLCYSENERNCVTLKFKDAGVYSFDSIEVIEQPMKNYVDNINERKKNILNDLQISDNGFSGNVKLTEPQLMFFSVPYSKGFEAYIDGEKAEILRANTWGMALDIDAGQHQIEFRYRTPGLVPGIMISTLGFATFGTILCLQRKKKNKNK